MARRTVAARAAGRGLCHSGLRLPVAARRATAPGRQPGDDGVHGIARSAGASEGAGAAPGAAVGSLQPYLAGSETRGARRRRFGVLGTRRHRSRAVAAIARDGLGAWTV